MGILWEQTPVGATLIGRLNRFVVEADLGSGPVRAHLANSGRLGELLVPGQRVYLLPQDSPGRKTDYDLALVELGGILVSVDARLPRLVVADALKREVLSPFEGWELLRHEPRYGAGRLDLELGHKEAHNHQLALVETKSVTLVATTSSGRSEARFPDAPTVRGRRHLEELADAAANRYRAAVVFVIGRGDADVMAPNWAQDPDFARTLADVSSRGVEMYAYRCRVSLNGIELESRVPIDLGKEG